MNRYEPSRVVDEWSLAVVNSKGSLKILYCPFRVLCIQSAADVKQNTWYYISRVGAEGHSILYFIGQRPYPHTLFHIYIFF